jgi:hypothetical protein
MFPIKVRGSGRVCIYRAVSLTFHLPMVASLPIGCYAPSMAGKHTHSRAAYLAALSRLSTWVNLPGAANRKRERAVGRLLRRVAQLAKTFDPKKVAPK